MHLTEQVVLKSLHDTGYLRNELRAYGCTSRCPASTSHHRRETKVVEENKAEASKQAEAKDYQTSEWLCRLVLTRCAWPLGFNAACPACPTLQPDHWVFELVNARNLNSSHRSKHNEHDTGNQSRTEKFLETYKLVANPSTELLAQHCWSEHDVLEHTQTRPIESGMQQNIEMTVSDLHRDIGGFIGHVLILNIA